MVFPYIENFYQIENIFRKNKNFIITKKEDYIVINYIISSKETFPIIKDENDIESKILREGRGLIFSTKGKILSRPLHKFFNLGEREDSSNIDFFRNHLIMDKLDGSMIRPFFTQNKIRWGTKMGVTDISYQVEEFLKDKKNYIDFANDMLKKDFTPIFEWISKKQRIVLEYDNDDLVLLAIRNNITGEYVNRNILEKIKEEYSLSLVDVVDIDLRNLSKDEIYKKINQFMKNKEGVVVSFDDGEMIKIKTEQYVNIHKAKDQINDDKMIVKSILNNTIDDVLVLFDKNSKEYVTLTEKIEKFDKGMINFLKIVSEYHGKSKKMNRKDFALDTTIDPFIKNIVFGVYDKDEVTLEDLKKIVIAKCNNNSNFEFMRKYINF